MRTNLIKGIVCLLFAAVLSACASYKPLNPAFHRVLQEPYALDAGDSLRITVFDQEDLTNTYMVDKAGYVAFPLVGAVAARGKTTKQLEHSIAAGLRNGYLRSPDVSVEVATYRPFFIMGEVGTSGQYTYVPGMTIQNAIAIAGGYSARAEQLDADVTRNVNACSEQGSLIVKIIHVFRSPVGGIFRHVRDLLAEQNAKGHEVGIICDSNTGGEYEDSLFEQIMPMLKLGLHRVYMARSISPMDLVTIVKTWRILSSVQPDIVHTHGAKGGFHGRMAGSFSSTNAHQVKTYYCPHGGAMHYGAGSLKGRVFFAAERFLERFTDSLIFVSDYERNAYHEKVGKPVCDEAIVYNGLADNEFEPVDVQKDAADFLYIGMMRDLKGPDVFLEALHLARQKSQSDLKAVFVGDGPDKDNYVAQISRLALQDAVEIHPAMPARQAFAKAKVVVVPSRAESMPYLVLEAIAGHMPIVATNVGGIPEIFLERSAKLVTPGDAQELSDAMQQILTDQKRQAAAIQFAEDLKARFSLQVMADTVEKVYGL